jgi:hypothetical protein
MFRHSGSLTKTGRGGLPSPASMVVPDSPVHPLSSHAATTAGQAFPTSPLTPTLSRFTYVEALPTPKQRQLESLTTTPAQISAQTLFSQYYNKQKALAIRPPISAPAIGYGRHHPLFVSYNSAFNEPHVPHNHSKTITSPPPQALYQPGESTSVLPPNIADFNRPRSPPSSWPLNMYRAGSLDNPVVYGDHPSNHLPAYFGKGSNLPRAYLSRVLRSSGGVRPPNPDKYKSHYNV